ncbi:MAG: hypothetical protein MZV70_51285 [Desulfobacterales bacterium]|nr:hypothetical protein [Desulfobacterales bacterium]
MEEILERLISEILDSQGIIDTGNPGKLYEELTARQYMSSVSSKPEQDGQISCHADLSRITFGERQGVLIVIRPAQSLTLSFRTATAGITP